MPRPIRVLQVLAQMNRGGAESMMMNLYRHMDRTKVQFDFIVHTDKKCAFDDEIQSLGGKIYRVPAYRGANHLRYQNCWEKFFKKYPEYKIIHGHVRSTAAIYLKIAKKYGLMTIAHSHSTSSGTGLSAIVKNILQYPIRYTADYLFACSESAGTWLFGERACKKDNFFIMNNAIDAKEFIYNKDKRTEKREEFQIEDKFVIGHVGRFQIPKNHEFLLDIFKAVHDKIKNAVLLLIGDGDLRLTIEKKVHCLGLSDSVIFTGVRQDIPELLQVMDVFVFPSLYEGLGIVTIEAQAAGLHCIAADTIPKEADVTDLMETVSLKESATYWASKILNYRDGYQRRNTYDQINLSGYDIGETTQWLENFYLSHGEERC